MEDIKKIYTSFKEVVEDKELEEGVLVIIHNSLGGALYSTKKNAREWIEYGEKQNKEEMELWYGHLQ